MGLALGFYARSFGAQVREAGAQIWIFPTVVLTLGFAWALYSDWRTALVEFFWVQTGARVQGLGTVLITFPTSACWLYSVSIRMGRP